MPETEASGNFTVRPITVSSTSSPKASTTRSSRVLHLARVQGARVVHRRQDAVEGDGGIQAVAHLVDRLDEQRDTAQCEELALQRDDHAVARGERIHGEQTERGLAVDEDDVVLLGDLAQHLGEDLLARHFVDEVNFRSREIDVGRDDVETVDATRHDHLVRVALGVQQQVVDRRDVVRLKAEAGRQGALRVEVDGEHLAAVSGQRRCEVDGRRRLADSALLVAQGHDARGAVPIERWRSGESAIGPPGRTEDRLVTGRLRLAAFGCRHRLSCLRHNVHRF